VAADQMISVAGRLRYATGGDVCVPVTYLAMSMGSGGAGPQHSDNICSLFVHYPGFKVVYPPRHMMQKDCLRVPYVMITSSLCLRHKICHGER